MSHILEEEGIELLDDLLTNFDKDILGNQLSHQLIALRSKFVNLQRRNQRAQISPEEQDREAMRLYNSLYALLEDLSQARNNQIRDSATTKILQEDILEDFPLASGKYGSNKREESALDKFMRRLFRVPDAK